MCPGCRYDLVGHGLGETTSAPTEVRCPECGLHIDVPRLLARLHGPPSWSYEHGPVGSVRRMLATLALTVVPWVLWKRLRPRHPIRGGRIMAIVAASLLAVHITMAAVVLANQRGVTHGNWAPPPEPVAEVLLCPYGATVVGYGFTSKGVLLGTAMLLQLMAMAMWAAAAALHAVLGWGGPPRVHLIRGWAYSVVPAGLLAITLVFVALPLEDLLLSTDASDHVHVGLLAGSLLVLGGWWWVFMARYLGVRGAALKASLVVILSSLMFACLALIVALAFWT